MLRSRHDLAFFSLRREAQSSVARRRIRRDARILDEWKRTDRNYTQRRDHILNGGGLNGSVKLNASNIFSSTGLKDSLTGGSNTDLFFAAVPGDLITDKVSGETVVDVG